MIASKTRSKKDKNSLDEERERSAITLQCAVRCFLAIRRTKKRANTVWLRVFDPTFKVYFFYNKIDNRSIWTCPDFVDYFNKEDHVAAALIQKVVRGFIGRMRARKLANKKYTRFFDAKQNKFYWMVNDTKKTTWKASSWLKKLDINMPQEDSLLFEATKRIRELENKLKEKDNEIKDMRKMRYEELEPLVIKDKVTNAKTLRRSKDMDEWKIEDLAAWFTELKMEEYIPFLFSNR